jgi:DNA polymerase III gamma/tau subunit
MKGLIETFHACILAKAGAAQPESVTLSAEEWLLLKESSLNRSIEEMELIFQVFHQGLDWIARSPHPKLVLDVLLIKAASAEILTSIGATAPASISAVPTSAGPTQKPTPLSPKPATPTTKTWEGLVQFVRQSRPLLASILENGEALRLPLSPHEQAPDSDLFVIGFSPTHAYYREQLQAKVGQEQLAPLLKEYFGRHVRLKVDQVEIGESLAAKKVRQKAESDQQARKDALQNPILIEARSLFGGGEWGPIELKGDAHAEPPTA